MESPKWKNSLNASWSVRMANRWLLKYGHESRMAHTIARHSRPAGLYPFPASVRERNQSPICFVVFAICLCRKTIQIWTLHASMQASCVYWSKVAWGPTGISMRSWLFSWRKVHCIKQEKRCGRAFPQALIKQSRDLRKARNKTLEHVLQVKKWA